MPVLQKEKKIYIGVDIYEVVMTVINSHRNSGGFVFFFTWFWYADVNTESDFFAFVY